MAASAKALSGDVYRLKIGTDVVALATGIDVSLSMGTREITTRDNCSFDEFLPTKGNGTISFDALLNHAVEANKLKSDDLFDLFKNKTVSSWELEPWDCAGAAVIVGEYKFAASGFITGYNASFPDKENATVAITIQLTGEPTYTITT